MTNEEAVRKLEYSKTAYQMLIDEKVDSGKLVGKDVKGEWKTDTPLDEVYKSMIEALEMGIKAIKALEQEPCDNAVSRQDVLDLAKKGVLISNGNYESVCKAINEIPPVNPQPCDDAISRAEAVRVASGYCHPANVAKELAKLPAVTPQPKTGHWIDDNENEIDAQYGRHLYKCSECNEYADMFVGGAEDWWDLEKPNYCPNCGCRMVEPQERIGEE